MRYLIRQNIVLFIVSLIVYYYNPSFGLLLLSLSIGLFVWELTRKKTKISPVIALLSCIAVFLVLEDYSTKRQARIIVAEVFDYYRYHDKTPQSLQDVFISSTMMRTSKFTAFTYAMKTLSKHRCEWKLEFSNIWGISYFYNDRAGKFEKAERFHGTNKHWNIFWNIEPHLKVTDRHAILD